MNAATALFGMVPVVFPAATSEELELRRRLQAEVRAGRRDYRRFCELRRSPSAPAANFDDGAVQIHLNPIRGWLRRATPAPTASPDDASATDVVLFAVGNEIRLLSVDERRRALLHELAGLGPTTLEAWHRYGRTFGCGAARCELVELVRIAAAAGLAACG